MNLILGIILGCLLSFLVSLWAAEAVNKHHCPNVLWSFELPDYKKPVTLGLCEDGLVVWKEIGTN